MFVDQNGKNSQKLYPCIQQKDLTALSHTQLDHQCANIHCSMTTGQVIEAQCKKGGQAKYFDKPW